MPSDQAPEPRPVLVRAAERGDLASLLGLYRQLAGDRPASMPASIEEAGPLFDAIVADPRRSLLVATVDGALAGTADVVIVGNLTHHARPWAGVENVVVDETHRRRGVGRSLMSEVVRRCGASNCYKIQLLSRNERHGAHDFYRSLGFESSAEGFRLYLDEAPGALSAPGPRR